jgi:hypothetical protein
VVKRIRYQKVPVDDRATANHSRLIRSFLRDSGPRTTFVQGIVENIFRRANIAVTRDANAKSIACARKSFFASHLARVF